MKFKRRFRRKFKYNKKRSFMFIFFFLVCLSFGLGYSLIQTDINIFGTTVLKDNRWDVHFDNIVEGKNSVSPTSEPEITDNTTVSFSAKLKNPGDKYEFLIDVVNAGTIDAKIGSITLSPELTAEQQNYFSYEVKYDDNITLNVNQALDAGSSETLKVTFKYLEQEDNSLYPGDDQFFNISITVNYIQGTGDSVSHPYLYNILMNEADNGGLAKKYTGSHRDSFTEEPSKDIYHWYASSSSQAPEIKNKNNVIFAGHCWQMIRTTDTGGVKMLYNGEVVNGKCLNNRDRHFSSFPKRFYYSSSGNNLWFGTDYVYDTNTGKYSISGDKVQTSIDPTSYNSVLGYYTCHSSNENATCDVLYKTGYYNTDDHYYYDYYTTDYNLIGDSAFSYNDGSISYFGYMYGDVYDFNFLKPYYQFGSSGNMYIYEFSSSFSNYWFSDQLNLSNGNYFLGLSAFKPSTDYSNLVGKYTLLNTDNSARSDTAYYVFKVENNTIFYKVIKGETSNFNSLDCLVSDSVSYDYSTGMYTLDNPTLTTIDDIYANKNNYIGKYTCSNTSTSCSRPMYFFFVNGNYIFGKMPYRIFLAKSRNGNQLIDTTIMKTELHSFTDYSDYKYLCKSFTSDCPYSDLERIIEFESDTYYSTNNFLFGSDVSWNGEKYTLVNTTEINKSSFYSDISNHHYFCLTNENSCSEVGFAFYHGNYNDLVYIILQNGKKIDDAISDSIENNVNDSFIKQNIDTWFKDNLVNYTSYLDDVIYCNNRYFNNAAGFSTNGSITTQLTVGVGSNKTDLSCEKKYDQFSVSNNYAKLKYPVALLSGPEKELLNYSDSSYHTLSPSRLSYYGVRREVNVYFWTGIVTNSNGIRPALTLKPGIKYTFGDGSMENPYIIDTE